MIELGLWNELPIQDSADCRKAVVVSLQRDAVAGQNSSRHSLYIAALGLPIDVVHREARAKVEFEDSDVGTRQTEILCPSSC